MSDIPPDLITTIFYGLPVKSLLRFRCVSKSTKALIDSPNFIKTHMLRQQTLKPNSDLKLVLNTGYFYSIDFNSIATSHPQQLDDPLKNGKTYVHGTCNGLLLLSSSNHLLCLWNPSTRVFLKLPPCDLITKPQGNRSLLRLSSGFGYDSSSDDYKVVRTAEWFSTADRSNSCQIMIYSLKSDSWRKVEECGYWFIWESDGELVGGVLHWLASDCRLPMPNHFVIGLNLTSEEIQLVPFPENLGEHLRLAVLGECLCLLDTSNHDVLDHVDIWVMKDYGVKESWIKLFSVGLWDDLQSVQLKPMAYSQNGREVFLQTDDRRFLWYCLETGSLENALVYGDDFASFLCLGTLVPLHGGGNGNKKEKSIDQDKREKRRATKRDDFLSKGFKLRL